MGSFIICTHHRVLLGRSNEGDWGGQGRRHVRERAGKCTGFWWEGTKQKPTCKTKA
jgi:hypothetical protein